MLTLLCPNSLDYYLILRRQTHLLDKKIAIQSLKFLTLSDSLCRYVNIAFLKKTTRKLTLFAIFLQKTCSQVKPEFFDLALNSFLKVQLESFHIKEPYIQHNVWIRINYALQNCYNNAKPHSFISLDENSTCSRV
jgi:hypothetical protein